MLDIVSSINSLSFIYNFQKSINQRGCPSHVISDCGRNLISFPAQSFVNKRGITWHKNPALSPWHVCFCFFFEQLVKSTKELLRKKLKTCKLTYEELQTAIFELESIISIGQSPISTRTKISDV